MITFVHEPKILSVQVSTLKPVWEIGKRSRFAHGIEESHYLEEGIQILQGDIFSVAEQIEIDIECEISERLARQINRHRHMAIVQKSTRYQDCIDAKDFSLYIPPQLTQEQQHLWKEVCMNHYESLHLLKEEGIPTELLNYELMLSTMTKVLYHLNLRTLIHMFQVRSCVQALPEFRDFLSRLKTKMSSLSVEWDYILQFYGQPQCVLKNVHSCKNPHLECSKRYYYQKISNFSDHLLELIGHRDIYNSNPTDLQEWDHLLQLHQKYL